jgi:filamentous hemagglutinin family protein
MLLPGLTIWTSPVMANPRGGSVVHGNVNIGAGTGGNLQIRQNSQNAIIDWEQFSIEAGELTQFRQPNSNAAVLNRVTGGDPSSIHGALRANGNVFVINPNGILVGPGGTIDVHGLVLSTLDVSNGEFLAGGDMTFSGVGEGVTNLGRINAIGGDVFLIGRTVTNSGSISATGTVGLAAGEEVLLTANETATGERMFVRAKGSGVSGTGIFNDGTIEGAAVELKAHGNIYALAINNKGSIRATGTTTSGGRVFLRGVGGTVENSGSIRATSSGSGSGGRVLIEAAYAKVDGMIRAQGGQVRISGTDKVEMSADLDATNSGGIGGDVVVEGGEIVLGNTAKIDASGATGGGNVRVGGGFQGRDATVQNADSLTVASGAVVRADALVNGAGGNVILWADNDTLFNGEVSARGVSRGGFAEISGKGSLNFDGLVDLTAVNGPAGTLLLDPTNVTISASVASANIVNNVALSALLDQGTNVIISTNFGGAEAGNITVNDRVEWYQENAATTPGTLTLLAMGNVQFNRSVRSAGTGGINVVAGWNGFTGIVDPIGSGAQTTPGAFDMAAILATMPGGASEGTLDAAGLNAGSVFVNAANGAQQVEVGSRFGSTLIAAHDLFVTASNTVGDDRWAQVGFHDSGYEYAIGRTYHGTRNEWWGTNANSSGGQLLDGVGAPIPFTFGNVRNKNYIADLGGTAFVGGAFQGAGSGATGAIEIGLSGRLDMRGADNRSRGYAQIGHGGVTDGEPIRGNGGPFPLTTRDGFIMDAGQDNNRNYFSATWRTNYLGHAARVNAPISVTASEDILVSAARGFETTAGYTDLSTPDQGGGSYALIGHGGYRQAASLHGDISVEARGATLEGDLRGLAGSGIQLRGNGGSGGFAQIGHGSGGGANRTSIWDLQRSGSITVTATTGAVRLLGFNQLPRAGSNRNTGAILDVNTSLGNNSAMDPSTLYSHVQIGHGQSSESAPVTGAGISSNTALQGFFAAPASVENLYDASNATFANPAFTTSGANVRNVRPEGSMSGDITVFAGGTVSVRDNMGYDAAGNWTPDPGPGTEPYLTAGGILRDVGIEVRAGNEYYSYGMIGHGGTQTYALETFSTGFNGNIAVEADKGGVMFVGGEEKRADRTWGFGYNFAQVGHGGINVQGTKQGSIEVLAGQGVGATDGDIIFRSGRMRQSYTQIGHGGQEFTRSITGDGLSDIIVRAKGDVELTSRLSGPSDVVLSNDYVDWAMGEKGSGSAGNAELLERVVGTLASGTQIPQSGVQGHNWDTNIKYAMIGHGGSSVNLNGVLSLNNTIEVEAQEGSVRITAGGGDRDFTQIGHGGYRTAGTNASVTGGDITVDAAGDIIVDASNPGTNMVERSSMIGIVTRDALGNFLYAGQNQILGRGFGSYGMIGNGGYEMDGDHSGTITLTAGGDIHAIGPKTLPGIPVVGYTGGFVEGPSTFPASGTQNYWIGNRHTLDTLVEASMMQRSFTLYHGNEGASETAHRGNIVPGTVVIDIASTGGQDLRDAPNGDGVTGTLYRSAAAIGGNYAAGTHGVAYGTIDYTTGKVTVDTSAVTANTGDLENDRNQLNRNIDYQYANSTLAANVVINDERTAESDTAMRPNEAFLGHGRVLPGTLALNVGGTIYREAPALNGTIVNAANAVIATIDYDTGRIRFRQNVNPTAAAVSADYEWAVGNSDSSFVQIGNGGQGAGVGGRDSIGNTGNISLNAGGDVRFHAGGASNAYALLGHGGTSTQSANSGDISLIAGGIVEFLAGNANNYTKTNQYAQLGHGGFDADGSHTGNILVQAGIGARSLVPGVIGGGATAGVVFTAGDSNDTYAMLGHGGRSSQAGVPSQGGLLPGQAGILSGDITVTSGGAMTFTAGTRLMHPIDNGAVQDNDDGRNFVMVGHGGWDGDVNGTNTYTVGNGHRGNISLTAQAGDIELKGGDTANGSAGEGYGRFHFAHIGHGGYATSGDHFGNISVLAQDGSIKLTGGMLTHDRSSEKYNWSMIGHGGGEATSHLGRLGETITVKALGADSDILLRGGGGNRNLALIGNGGLNVDGSHLGDITVHAGRNIDLRGGTALERVVTRIGEFQEMNGVNGGDANDIGEYNGYYGASGLGYVMLDAAASTGGGAKAKLMGDEIQPGTVQFRLAIAAPTLFDANKTPEYSDDGNGNIVETANPTNIVGTINYATGEMVWNTAIVGANNPAQPDVFVNYGHRTGIRNDALYAAAVIGHGGYATNSRAGAHPQDTLTPGFVNRGISGNIDVRAGVDATGAFNGSGGSLTGIAGNDQRTYVQIGHGGMDANAAVGHALSGTITTKADGAITFQGGGGLVDNQHIAFNYYGTGNTEVTAVTAASDADRLRYSTPLGTTTRSNSGITDILFAFAHIGHGGVTVHANNGRDNNSNDPLALSTPESGHNGDILVESANGDIDFTGGGVRGYGHFAMIGHGGYSVLGNHYGNIDVISGADINFTGGGNTYRANSTEGRNFVQIGHGGRASTGNLLGDIDVDAAGAVNFQGGDVKSDRSAVAYGAHLFVLNAAGNQDENHYNRTEGRLSRAQIGHGGDNVYGDKTGAIDVTAGAGINFRGGDRVTGSLDNNAGYLNYAQIGHGGYAAWRQYRTNIALPGNTGQADEWGIPFWHDGTQFIFDGTGQFPWPNDNSINPALGLGNPLNDGFNGNVTVTATTGNINFQGGTSVGTFAQVGHGGVETGGDHSGNLTVSALAGDIDFSANRIEETASTSSGSYNFVQIGHGGAFSSGEAEGDIDVSASGKIRFKGGRQDSFAMVGHGGRESHGTSTIQWGTTNPAYRKTSNFLYSQNSFYRPGTRTGDISVDAGGNIEFIGGNRNGDRAFTQIGHGGFNIHADPASANGDGHSGSIDVVSTGGSILLRGGDRANSHALIGHGGTESFGNHGGDGTDARADSDIVVQAKTGINVMATGRFDSNNVARNFAQIGHGGWRSSNRDIEDIDGARYGLLAPYSNYTNPLTGTGNTNNAGLHPLTPSTTDVEGIAWRHPDRPWGIRATLGTFKGDITVRTTDAGADIRFIAPDASEGTLGVRGEDSYVQLGHGGWRNFANLEGDITVESGGELEFRALQGTANAPNVNSNHNVAYAQLGHGGFESGGQFTGNIDVTTGGDILFRGADSINGANAGYAQIGHGGYNSYRGTAQYREALRDPITGVAPAEIMQAGNTGNINVNGGGDISFLAGRDFATYTQIGHGGYVSRDSHTGNIDISAVGGIRFIASIDDFDGPGNNPGNNNDSWAQIGHGGVESDGSHKGNITVRAGEFAAGPQIGYGLYFKGGNWDENYAQLGHGGYGSRSYGNGVNAVGFQGDIDVEVNGDITFVAGTYSNPALFTNEDGRNYAQLGHGGVEADTSQDNLVVTGLVDAFGNPIGHSGDIRVVATDGSINFLAGDTARTFEPSAGTGRGNNHYAQLGHGGASSHGNHYGDITVQAGISSNLVVGSKGDGDILFASGGGSDNEWADVATYAQLGHGGRGTYGNFGLRDAGGNPLNTISVMAGRDITFTAADASPSAFALLGMGGYDARGDHFSNIQVFAERNIRFVGGNRYSGTPAAGTGRIVRYGHDARTDGNNATINQDRAANLNDGANFNILYPRVVPGSVSVAVRLDNGTIIGTLSDADGNGTLTADADITADFQDGLGSRTINAGTHVGNVVYAGEGTSTITFLEDVNPGATAPSGINTEAGDAGTINLWITLAHGDQSRTFAQLGNGGYDSDNPNDTDLINGNKGNIFVTARTGGLSLLGGQDDDSFAQIGHGGRSTRGANTGNIVIRTAADLDLIAGPNRDREYAQIGHGGWDADGAHSGKIVVSAGSGDLFTSLGTGRFNDVGDFNGDLTPDTVQFFAGGTGQVNLLGGQWTDNWAMIGHGGRSTTGNHSGHIGVSATGNINLIGGSGARGFAQIGHGGWDENSVLNLSGDIHVISEGGDLRLKAGSGGESYALIGHGDDQDNNTANSQGSRQGRIQVIADHITLDRNTNRAAWIGHSFDMVANNDDPFANQDIVNAATVNLGGGYEVIGRSGLSYMNNGALISGGTITITDNFRERFITPNLKDANFAFSGGNLIIDTVIDSTTSYSNPASVGNSVTFLAAGDIDVNRRIVGPGAGSINLVAGAGLASASIVDDPSRTGGSSGTNLNYQRIDHLWNGNVPTGYIDFSKVRGDGLQFGNANGFAITSTEFDNAGGEISIDAINNGGNFNLGVGSKSGETNALGYGVRLIGGNAADEYAQLGFFTDAAADPATGNIWVGAKTGGVLVQSGTAARTSSQIGHGGNGGNTNLKDLSGSISVRADGGGAVGNVSVLSGTGDTGQAQIGHGGRQNDGNHSGDILVIGEGITVTSAASAAQIGHGGFQGTGSYTGDLFINFDPLANAGAGAAVGGGGALAITAGAGFDDYAQIGHGGVVASGGSRTGNIIVGQSAGVTLQGGTNKSTSAQLGHGGVGSGGGVFSGSIEVNTTGNVSVLSGTSATSQGSAFAMIGHGGTGASGAKSGDITIDALGTQITVAGPNTGVVSNSNFAQIGHGGDAAGNTLSGNIDINAPNAGLSLLAGNQARAFAKVGHGGFNSGGTQSGTIDLILGGAVNLSAGGDHSIAQIGHGGSWATPGSNTGNRDGAISLVSSTGNLSMLSGAGLNAFTQIGHGGVGATGSHGSSLVNGGIHVGIAGNILLNAGAGTDAYTQIGQGGSGAAGTHLGDICVHADGTITFNNGLHGAGTRAYGQIGHGGYNAPGNHSGEITVVSGFVDPGGITMKGGSGTDQYVQIGHGGTNASGNLSGRVYVVADNGGDLVMNGGSAAGTYAMISHGDGHGTYDSFGTGTTSGTRQGGIQYFVDGDAILNAGTGANSNVHLIHRTNSNGGLNLTTPNYLGGDGYQYVVNGTSSSTNGTDHNKARENESTIIAGNFGTGNIVVTNTGDLTLSNPLVPTGEFVNHSFSFIVMATGNLNFERSFQNAGTGLVALVAGWDGVQDLSTINYNNGPCDPEIIPGSIDFNDCDRFGNNNGILTIGSSTQAGPFAVGSRQGQTILRGYGINVVGSNTTAGGSTQIGFRADGSGDITGTIDVQAKQGGLTLQGGTADNAFVQIGHGTGSGTFSNNVTSSATVDISFCEPGAVTLNGGGNGAFAMIGNGGGTGNYTRNGNVTITDFAGVSLAGGTGTGAFTQIGNGGLGGQGVINSVVSLNGQGNVSLAGGTGGNAFAHIGAGGLNHAGAVTGTTSVVTTGGNLSLSGGSGANAGSFAQLGAGGLNVDGAISGAVTATIDGSVQLTGGSNTNSYVQIGVGGSGSDGTKSGDVAVSGTSATLTGGTGAGSNVLVGNGGGTAQGASDNASGGITGNVSLTTSAGAVTMNAAGAAVDNFVQIGAGGRNAVGNGNTVTSATIVTTAAGGLTMDSTNASYVLIGAGGQNADATSYTGNVLVNVGGTAAIFGGSGANRSAQIGNGGTGTDGTKNGNTTVNASSLQMTSGTGGGASVLIGLGGGREESGDTSNGTLTGNVLVTTSVDGITLNAATSGAQSSVQIGNGGLIADGSMSGTTTVNSAGSVSLAAGSGSNTYARIGAGGSGVDGTITNGTVSVTGTNLTMTSGSGATSAYTQIGAGGGASGGGNLFLGSITGDVNVTMTGVISMNAGTGSNTYSQIGAGGAGVNGSAPTNTITSATTVSGASLTMNSNSGSGAYVQIGAGGGTNALGTVATAQGSITGNVNVSTTAGGITMGGINSGTRSYVQIGAGGSGIESGAASLGAGNTITSNTTVTTVGGDLTMNSSLSAYNQIGAGGLNSDGTLNGAVNVTVGGALSMTGGVGTRRSAQIGNGGSQSDGAKSGAINVSASSVNLTAGTTERAYAQIGHGGADASGVVSSANITVNSIGAISLASGGNQAFTQIGHGGFSAINLTVPNSSITINNNVGTGTGDITLTGGSGTNASSIIGHGGARADGSLNVGDISATGDVSILRAANVRVNGGGNTDSFAQIGHAGERAMATFGGNVSVTSSGEVLVSGGTAGTGAYGQIGHGGRLQTGAKSGTITVAAAGPLSLLGGTATGASAQIGHGGSSAAGIITGDIALSVGGAVSLLAGSQSETYAQVGHGGHLATGSFGGNVGLNYNFGTNQVTGAAGSFTMSGGSGAANDAYAQFGHGGTGNNTSNVKSGNVVVGGVTSATLSGGTSTGGDNFVQVGHGGDENDGDATGSVALLSSGPVTLNGSNTGSDGYVQIGLGGHEATGNFGMVGDVVSVIGLGIDLNGGSGTRSSVQVGSGGYNADGALTGSVFVNVNPLTNLPVGGGAITVNAGSGTESFAQIGLGGSAQDGDKNGNTTIQGASLEVVAGSGAAGYAQIGSGSGIRSDLTDFGSGLINTTTSVTATSGGVTVSAAGAGAHSFAQIGGGGLIADGALSGSTGMSTVVNALGDIVLTGGGNSNTYAMIGLGGSGGDGVKSLAGTSVTGASVTMTGGSGSSAFTQIGSGGGMTGGNNVSAGSVTGDTTLTTTLGGITATSGTGGNAYSLIGAGGSNLAGDLASTVVVNSAGGLSLNSAAGGAGAFTQVGLGGLNADGVHTGTTTVNAVGGISLTGGATDHAYSQIGAGGVGSDGNKVNSSVSVRGASVSLTSGAGAAASTQIGSGGGATSVGGLPTGNVNGAVNVVTTMGGISLNGGGDRSFAQIGHGGGGRNGDFTGEIQIVSADGLGITGGTTARGYALVGHGGTADAGGFTTGLREGNVLVSVAGLTQLADGAATAFLGHRGAGGVTGASRLALVTGQLDTATNATGVTGMIANVIGAATVEIGVTNGNLLVNGPAMNYNSANVVDLFASGNTTVLASLQNAGAGSLNLVAGWDGTTGLTRTVNPAIFPPISALALDYSAVLADAAAYTNNGGVVSIGDGTQTTPLAVGVALGETNLLGDGVALVAGNAPGALAQVGFRGTSNALINGAINVGVGAGGLALQSADQSGAFTQIGHGGAGATSAPVQADINLDFVNGGDLTVTAGNANAAYAQVGHGGASYNGSIIGDITASGTIGTLALAGGGAASQASYAQIGHGGDSAFGAKNGNISLEAEEVSVEAGDGFRSGAQIGHGGRGGVGTLAGGIDVTTTLGDLTVAAGGGNLASAQVGHGGLGYSGVVNDQSITLDVAGSLTAKGGTAIQASALIGHGGTSSTGGTLGGDVVVNVGDALEVTGGSGLTAFAQIGHGGALVTANLSGDITVVTGGDVDLAAPNSATSGAYAKIGHGDDMRGSFGAAAGTGTRSGNIQVAADGGLVMNQALIGHSNSTSNATSAGTTQVGVSWLDPSDPTGGNLVADSTSEFGGDELRFYVPRRANNQVAAGAMMNGVTYGGGTSDPYPTKGADEFANYVLTESGTIQLAEHDSTFGSGPAPTVAGTFGFYFDTIVQGTPVEPPLPPEPPVPPVPPLPDYRGSVLDDRVIDDWIRDQEMAFSTPGTTEILYEGYYQYGPNGEPIFDFNNAAGMDPEEEDVLRRQLERIEEQSEQANQSGGTGEASQGAE